MQVSVSTTLMVSFHLKVVIYLHLIVMGAHPNLEVNVGLRKYATALIILAIDPIASFSTITLNGRITDYLISKY